MATKYTTYSDKRDEIMQQVRRVERKGFVVPAKYHLPIVRELRKMSAKEQSKIMEMAERLTTAGIGRYSKKTETVRTKTGKVKTVSVSYNMAKKKTKAAAAKAGAETRRRKREYQRKKAEAEEKYSAIADYGYDTMGDIADYEPPADAEPIVPELAEPKTYTDERGNIVDLETGEVIHDASVHTAIDEEGNIYDVETGEVYGNREQYADYMQAKAEGVISEEQTFEDWLASMANEPTGQAYVQTVSDFLEMQDEEEAANLINEMAEEENIFDPVGFNRRMANGDLPDVGDFYYTDNNGDVHFNVRSYVQLAQVIKGRKLRASELRKISKAIGHD